MIRGLVWILLFVFEKVLSTAFKKLLIGAGLGLTTFVLTQSMFTIFLNYVHSRFNLLSDLFYLIDLTGLDIALSYVVSAISIRLTMSAGKLSLRKM